MPAPRRDTSNVTVIISSCVQLFDRAISGSREVRQTRRGATINAAFMVGASRNDAARSSGHRADLLSCPLET